METRKVQRLGPSTLAMTLPATWTEEFGVEKGDEVHIRRAGRGTLTVTPAETVREGTTAVIHADELGAEAVERAIVAQYVLGRRVIRIEQSAGPLSSAVINAVYDAESQLMGLGVIEETPDHIAIRCSVDPADFTLENLLQRLERTGATMRDEAVTALLEGDPDLAERALNRERQANKIFVLCLRLVMTAYREPNLAADIGLEDGFPLIGYRSIVKNLELTADNAQDIAEIVREADAPAAGLDDDTRAAIRELTDRVDDITALAVAAAVDRDYDATIETRALFREISAREGEVLGALPELSNAELLRIREILVALQQTAQYAMRNAEIAANLALNEDSAHVSID